MNRRRRIRVDVMDQIDYTNIDLDYLSLSCQFDPVSFSKISLSLGVTVIQVSQVELSFTILTINKGEGH